MSLAFHEIRTQSPTLQAGRPENRGRLSFRRLLFYAVTQPNAATGGGRHGQCVALNLVLGVFLRQAVCEGLERRATIVGAIDRSRSVSARALGPSHTQQSH